MESTDALLGDVSRAADEAAAEKRESMASLEQRISSRASVEALSFSDAADRVIASMPNALKLLENA